MQCYPIQHWRHKLYLVQLFVLFCYGVQEWYHFQTHCCYYFLHKWLADCLLILQQIHLFFTWNQSRALVFLREIKVLFWYLCPRNLPWVHIWNGNCPSQWSLFFGHFQLDFQLLLIFWLKKERKEYMLYKLKKDTEKNKFLSSFSPIKNFR